ncbi:beta-hexosaminidase subunit alpha-like [Oppia nitens]|uniref:beta-hexosaminidase subunit alpha-like n=1 Tax=Oppia nitens TaxID=1686743 RepID=UPI0023D9B803|nr:beta-hexosaminidase subunit alpha-like [Oppia nitens]
MIINETFFIIDPNNFHFVSTIIGDCDLLDKAIARYKKLFFIDDCSLVDPNGTEKFFDEKSANNLTKNINFKGILTNITILVSQECETEPDIDMIENYSIDINDRMTLIYSESVWGAIRALETMSQLIENVGYNQFIVNYTSINDFPRFKYRGLLIDTARHYISVQRLEQSLDAMAYNKLNVFHWHMTDDQSIPYVSQVYPKLSLKGAYNSKTHIYTIEDINRVINYAKERGIRVVIELDTPGHTLAWGKAYPELMTQCYTNGKPNGNYGPLDPSKQSTYDFIEKLFKEILDIFPDQYIHIGGDEVDYNCWRSNPNIIDYMRAKSIIKKTAAISKKSDIEFAKLEEHYIKKVIDIVRSLNRSSIVWQEIFDNKAKLLPDTIIHVWKYDNWQSELFNVTKAGYQVILSSCWYLNRISYGTDWHKYYTCEPFSFKGTEQQNNLIIGGEATIWGEWVDGSNLIGRTWPRGLAVAERLWSSREMKNAFTANRRFNRQHCLMQTRGLRVEPSNGVGHCHCDHFI